MEVMCDRRKSCRKDRCVEILHEQRTRDYQRHKNTKRKHSAGAGFWARRFASSVTRYFSHSSFGKVQKSNHIATFPVQRNSPATPENSAKSFLTRNELGPAAAGRDFAG